MHSRGSPNKGGQNQKSKPPLGVTMMPLGAPSISKYGSLVRPDTQIVALRAHCARTALEAPPLAMSRKTTYGSPSDWRTLDQRAMAYVMVVYPFRPPPWYGDNTLVSGVFRRSSNSLHRSWYIQHETVMAQ